MAYVDVLDTFDFCRAGAKREHPASFLRKKCNSHRPGPRNFCLSSGFVSRGKTMLDFCRILTEAQQGETAAIEAIFSEFADDVRFVCLDFQLANTVDLSRSDLFQEAWVRIFVQIDRFQIQENSSNVKQQFRVWLRQIARNEMIRVLEKRHAKKRSPPEPVRNDVCLEHQPLGDHSPSERFRQKDEMINLKTAIQGLDANSRAVIETCFLGGRTVKEMADILGLTYSEARTRLSKALAELKSHLGEPTH